VPDIQTPMFVERRLRRHLRGAVSRIETLRKEGIMDGRHSLKVETEKPIEKPSFPLPVIFSSGVYTENPTRRRSAQRAHFYRRRILESGTPVYDFYLSDEAEH
jgi:hypothetical protein